MFRQFKGRFANPEMAPEKFRCQISLRQLPHPFARVPERTRLDIAQKTLFSRASLGYNSTE